MSHRNARLTVRGRLLLVRRILVEGIPAAHVARSMGISRQCAHRWKARYLAEGMAGLEDRSSRPRRCPARTPAALERRVLQARRRHRCGPDRIGAELGVPARTVSRILARHGAPRLAALDPLTGQLIRGSRRSAHRYERARPGELVHVDVKKIGRVPAGGGWRAHGRQMGKTSAQKKARIGYEFIHSAVDDHSRLAYSEILADERADTCAGFLARAIEAFARRGIDRIEAIMTDNHLSYTRSRSLAALLAGIGARHLTIRPHCPWQNGKVERFNRTLQAEWAYRRVYRSNAERARALAPWLEHYNTARRHSALGGAPPISRVSPT